MVVTEFDPKKTLFIYDELMKGLPFHEQLIKNTNGWTRTVEDVSVDGLRLGQRVWDSYNPMAVQAKNHTAKGQYKEFNENLFDSISQMYESKGMERIEITKGEKLVAYAYVAKPSVANDRGWRWLYDNDWLVERNAIMNPLVYGTLKVGESNYERFSKSIDEECTMRDVPIPGFEIFYSAGKGSYPIATRTPDMNKVMTADGITYTDIEEAFEVFRMEYGAGYHTINWDVDGEKRAIYIKNRSSVQDKNKIPSGVWKR